MEKKDYPGLYRAADNASLSAQSTCLHTVQWQIFTLILGAALAINPLPNAIYSLANAAVFLAALGISIFIASKRYERVWYSARAVAESVKTVTWRYAMRTEPFLETDSVYEVNAVFRNMLDNILSSNNQIGDLLGGDDCALDQITPEMQRIRTLNLEQRKEVYLSARIDEQRKWYAKKSKHNKKRSSQFFVLLVALQAIAIAFVLLRIAFPEWKIWPTEIFVVSAGAVITWVQLKRFQEVATAYALTAHEIGIIRTKLDESNSDLSFSDFVRDAENAFSREHTQWIAKLDK